MKHPYKTFKQQFPAARREVERLREFMGEAANLATLTTPTGWTFTQQPARSATTYVRVPSGKTAGSPKD